MLANYGAEQIARTLLRQQAITTPTHTKVHLHTANPGSAGTANEVLTSVWTNYAPPTVNTDRATSPFWDTPAADGDASRSRNNAEISFGTATLTGDITVTHYSVRDHLDNVIDTGALSSARLIQNGDPVRFPAESFQIRVRRHQ